MKDCFLQPNFIVIKHVDALSLSSQKKLLSTPFSKAVILAALFYISTRSIKWTIVLLGLYFIIINKLSYFRLLNIYNNISLTLSYILNVLPFLVILPLLTKFINSSVS